MRQLASHLGVQSSPPLEVLAADESGFGSTCYQYEINGFLLDSNSFVRSDGTKVGLDGRGKTTILFQNGPVREGENANGVTVQSLLAVISDQLQQTEGQDESGLVHPEVLINLGKAMSALNSRDRRLSQATANAVHVGVPALN